MMPDGIDWRAIERASKIIIEDYERRTNAYQAALAQMQAISPAGFQGQLGRVEISNLPMYVQNWIPNHN